MELRELSLRQWDDELPGEGYEVFHQPEALSVLRDHLSDYDLRLFVGFENDRASAFFPVFVRSFSFGGQIIASPPPGLHIPHLGPFYSFRGVHPTDHEKRNFQFVRAVIDELGQRPQSLFYILCSPDYDDPRPYLSSNQCANVSFTYYLETEGRSTGEMLETFSKSRRREIRASDGPEATVERGGLADVRAVYEQAERRLSERNENLGVSWPLVRDLYSALGDRARVYVARAPNGEFLSGIIALQSQDTVSYWLGGFRPKHGEFSVNTLLHWGIVRDVIEDPQLEPVTRYDMVGASEHRLSRYKSKFNPQLREYYVIDSGGKLMDTAKAVYQSVERLPGTSHEMSSVFW